MRHRMIQNNTNPGTLEKIIGESENFGIHVKSLNKVKIHPRDNECFITAAIKNFATTSS